MQKGKDSHAEPDNLHNMRHSAAHLLAAAVQHLWPDVKLGVGPVIENGFYYDFDLEHPITPEDLKLIEKKMRGLQAKGDTYEREEVSLAEAKKRLKAMNQPYKVELVEAIEKTGSTALTGENLEAGSEKLEEVNSVTFYKTGDFVDLCRGGHVESTKEIGPFKLMSIAGAYWRGNEKNPQMQRVYGTCWPTQEAIDAYLNQIEEAKKRDHKKLGKELELFMFHETAPGMPYWLPKGVVLYNQLIDFWRKEHSQRGYHEIVSPLINKKELYITSGHYDHYWQEMFVAKTAEGEEYGLKAMNCPNAMVVFGHKPRSYRDLPLRFSDTDPLHRNELSGVLNGLLRVREFRQDDAHCFVAEADIGKEYTEIFEIVERFYSIFGMTYSFRLGTRPKEFLGDIETWDRAEATLKKILEESDREYTVADGDGAFYGPKVDILMKDALGRTWQMGTVQLDFQQPRRFGLTYTDQEGKEQTPVAIHRVVYGSLERFIGILIEHTAGKFPFWLAPVQMKLLPIADRHLDYAHEVAKELLSKGYRVEVDKRSESVGKKIRDAQLEKVPYMLVVGDKEIEAKTVAVRSRDDGDLGVMTTEEFQKKIQS